MLHPVSLSFSFSTERPPPRSAWIKIPGNIRGPGTIGLSPRTRVLLQDLQDFKTYQILRQSLFAKYRHTQLVCDGLAFRKVRNKCRPRYANIRPSPSCAPYNSLAITQSTYTSTCAGKDSPAHPPSPQTSRRLCSRLPHPGGGNIQRIFPRHSEASGAFIFPHIK